jgi:HlyD family secretion protein
VEGILGGKMKHTLWGTLCIAAISLQLLILGCGNNSKSSTYTGVLEGKSVQVPALTGGKVVKLLVDTGEEVKEGAVLAVIDTTELVLQRTQLGATLEELAVQKEIAETSLKRSKADLEYVQQREGRMKMLYENQAMPKQNLDDLRNEMQRAQSAYEAARQQVRSLESRKKQIEAQAGMVEKRISDAVIIAPVEGLVSTLYYEVGEAVPPMQPVLELIHVSELEVKIYIPEKELPNVKHGQEVKIRVDGVKEELPGRVSWVSPKAEFTPKTILTPETRTSLVYAVKVTIPNPKRVLKHGMPAEVIL